MLQYSSTVQTSGPQVILKTRQKRIDEGDDRRYVYEIHRTLNWGELEDSGGICLWYFNPIHTGLFWLVKYQGGVFSTSTL